VDIESKLQDLGLVLPDAPKVPPGFKFSFAWTRVYNDRLYLSGHGAQAPDGSYIGPFGKVPSEVSLEEAQEATLPRSPVRPGEEGVPQSRIPDPGRSPSP
jgi:hypothetical protein